ncbi:MAG: prolyl oligopeptidase family serine peptidase [Candidatus Limnocylindria bacterium]
MTAIATEAPWRRRFRAPRRILPLWGRDRPERLLFASNESGKWELYAWDREHGRERQVTDRREGTVNGYLDPTGESIWWFDDTDGDELGMWRVEPFWGGEDASPLEELGRAYSTGLALGRTLAVAGTSSAAGGDEIHVLRRGRRPVRIYAHEESAWLSGVPRLWNYLSDLSCDERLFCFHHSEHGDSRHPALRVMTIHGETVADLWDGPGLGLYAAGWPPVPGDNRVLIHHERDGARRPMLWSPELGETVSLPIDLPGEVDASWYPDGRALLLAHAHAGRSELLRLDLATGAVEPLDAPRGVAGPAAARPDGSVWYAWSDASTPPQVRSTVDGPVLEPPREAAPGGRAYADLRVGAVHAFLAAPAAPRPVPTIVLVHGGPDSHDRDEFSPAVQAWVDHGFAVVLVNYRGSTGYGREWRDAITGNPGFTELEDILAVGQRVVDDGIADPARLVLGGASWGGYVTLLGLGTQPERWSAGVAAVPVGDYVAAYEDEMEPLKAYDRALFGGASPTDDPERYRIRSPITYADRVRVPVLILAGENDPRCPIRGIDNYVERLRQLGKDHEVLRFDAGHGSMRIDERIRQLAAQIDFLARRIGTTPPL